MDARQRRSRENLRRAILGLAGETAASSILASEVASVAGVNRSTFYEHAASPTALLEDVLREELDALREQHLNGASAASAASAIAAVTRSVLEHMEEHRAIYLLGLDENSGPASLHPMLAGHFEASIRLLFEQNTITFETDARGVVPPALPPPPAPPALPAPVVAEMATRMVADGSVGAILAWLRSPAPRSIDAFLAAYARLLPAWFPFAE